MKKIISPKNIALIALGLALGISTTYALAWTAPTVAPTGGNVAAPINTSTTAQVKTGNLGTSGALNAVGNISTTAGSIKTFAIGLAGQITARSFRATPNGGFEILGQPTGWMAAQQFCLTGNPATGLPGDAGYNCVNSSTGWGNNSLLVGTEAFQTLRWDSVLNNWTPSSLLKTDDSFAGNIVKIASNLATSDTVRLEVNGRTRIKGGTPAVNKVLTAQNAAGDATWATPGSQIVTIHGSSTGYRAHATCPNNYKVIGGGGICQNDNQSFPSPIQMSLPVNHLDPTMNTNNGDAVPNIGTTNLDTWLIVCYDTNVQHAWVMCIPN